MFHAPYNIAEFISLKQLLVGISVLALTSTAVADPPCNRRLATPNSQNVARPATQMGRVAWVTTTPAAFRPTTPSNRFTPMTTTAPARRSTPVTTTAPARRSTPVTTTAPPHRFTPYTTTAPARRFTPMTTTAPARRFTPVTTTAPVRSQENDFSHRPIWDDNVELWSELSVDERIEYMLEYYYLLRHSRR